MAEVVLGLGTSHSPMLSMPPELWRMRGEMDQRRQLWTGDGQSRSYAELLETADPAVEKELTLEKLQARHEANQRGIAKIGEVLREVSPDVLVIIGDDQQELYHDHNMPAMAVYWGEQMLLKPRVPAPDASEDVKASVWGYGEVEQEYPIAASLARHIMDHLIEEEFDVARSNVLPSGKGMSHSFAFVYRRIMDEGPVIPTVPLWLNTYYPPNQPTPHRCYEFGRKVREGIEGWDSGARVAVLASGGLSHFVVQEDLDHQIIKALEEHDVETLVSLPRPVLNSGTSEVRNWIAAAGALENLQMKLVDYVPCYRSPAGTGCGMGFAQWR